MGHLRAYCRIVGTNGAGHVDAFRHDVRRTATIDHAHRDYGRRLGEVGAAAYNRLQAVDDLRRGHYRVDSVPRHAAMTLLTYNLDVQVVTAGGRGT
ncbi:hypothetical protein D3C81_486980 [compost metagenome]